MPKRKRRVRTKRLDEIEDAFFAIPRIPGSQRRGRGSSIMSNESKKWNTKTFECHFDNDGDVTLGELYKVSQIIDLTEEEKFEIREEIYGLFLTNVRKKFSEDRNSSFAFIDSLWFSLYLTESSKEKVLDWIKKKRIFSKKYVIIPIVCWGHWRLLIFCHFDEVSRSKKRTPCMLLLDSLHMANPKRIEPDIRRFVMDIYKVEERPESERIILQIPLLVPEVPQQRNGEDCGLFVLYFTILFVENAPENFSASEGYPYFMKKDWFSLEDLEEFSDKLSQS